jgi:hypothetical protein
MLLGRLGDCLRGECHLCHHLVLHELLRLELDDEKFHRLLDLLQLGIFSFSLQIHGVQHELSLRQGLGLGLRCRGDHSPSLAKLGWIYGLSRSTNDFVSLNINRPPSGIL